MFDRECAAFIRAGNRELPCREARRLFAQYVRDVAQDVCDNNPEADFSLVVALLGGSAEAAAVDFLESREETVLWKALNRRRKHRIRIAVTAAVVIFVLFAVCYIHSDGLVFINTQTTVVMYEDPDVTMKGTLEQEGSDPS